MPDPAQRDAQDCVCPRVRAGLWCGCSAAMAFYAAQSKQPPARRRRKGSRKAAAASGRVSPSGGTRG